MVCHFQMRLMMLISMQPNCYTKVITVDGQKKIFIYAKRHIAAVKKSLTITSFHWRRKKYLATVVLRGTMTCSCYFVVRWHFEQPNLLNNENLLEEFGTEENTKVFFFFFVLLQCYLFFGNHC